MNEEAKKTIEDSGEQRSRPDGAEREAFKKEVVPSVWQQYGDVIGQDLIDELLAKQKQS